MELTAPQPGQKKCKRCPQTDMAEFGIDRSKPDGLAIYCRACRLALTNSYRQAAAAKRKAEAEAKSKAQQLVLPIIDDNAEQIVSDAVDLADSVLDVLRKENRLSRRQIVRRVQRDGEDVGDALALLWDRNKVKPKRDTRGEAIWTLRDVA